MADYRAFFVTDIHASDVCFRKFLNAARFYECKVLIMGGDMTGKMLVPIVDHGGGRWSTRVFDHYREFGEAELPAIRKLIADAGYYAYETTVEGVKELEDSPAAVEALFEQRISETVKSWLTLAEQRLNGNEVVCYMAPGNDDPPFVDALLRTSSRVINPEGALVELPGGFPMISVGYSNPTPWDSPRELPEDQLLALIDKEAGKVSDPTRAIFNLHVPPKDTPIDQAVLVDAELRPVIKGGMPAIAGVGSSAVRTGVERYQPMLALHGHIHESRGEAKLGRTLCLNPGSEYSEGVLRGVILTMSEK
ncbi:MAG: metallophosphoesterase, partial [Candidatus Dormibacter sp.]